MDLGIMVTLFVLYINSKAEIEVFVIAAMAIILFLTESTFRTIRVYKIFDRIDIQVEISPLPFSDLSKASPGEPSERIRTRVMAARKLQEERYRSVSGIHCNAQMTEKMLQQYAQPDERGLSMLRMAMERLSLSARAYSRILKVARTIADLEGSEKVLSQHIGEAIGYRNLDRSDWAERGA